LKDIEKVFQKLEVKIAKGEADSYITKLANEINGYI